MTENEAKDILSIISWNRAFKGYAVDCRAIDIAIKALEEIQQYRAIGTVEECRVAVERMKPKKPLGGADFEGNEYLICRECSEIVQDGDWIAKYCPNCGQALDWQEE